MECVSREDCPIDKPVCDTSTAECRKCVDNNDCPNYKPVCDGVSGECHICVEDEDCGPNLYCDPSLR